MRGFRCDLRSEVAALVDEWMTDQQLTHDQAAAQLGLSGATLRRVLRGWSHWGLSSLAAMIGIDALRGPLVTLLIIASCARPGRAACDLMDALEPLAALVVRGERDVDPD